MFNTGDKIICIDDTNTIFLELGQKFIVNRTFSNGDFVVIVKDNIEEAWRSSRFEYYDIKYERKQKLEKINEGR